MVERSNFSAKASKDLEIVEQALLGNEKAYAQLLDRYQDTIYFLLLKKLETKMMQKI